MTRHSALLVGVAVAAVVFAGVAVAHGNHASAGPQVSGNGSVVVEQAFLSERGYVAITTDPESGEGRVLGHRPLGAGLHSGVRVGVDSSYWAGVDGNVTLRVRLYADDGDGTFDPATDPVLRWFDQPAGGPFRVRQGPGPAYVVPSGDTSLTADGELRVARVGLPERGHLVVHDATNATLGPALGHRTLAAGHHAGVTVPVDSRRNRTVTVAVHRDDGDGRFDPASDPVVRVGEVPVATTLSLSTTGDDPGRIRIATPTATETPPAETPPAETTRTAGAATDTTTASGPGPGPVGTAGAVVFLVSILAWRRGRR